LILLAFFLPLAFYVLVLGIINRRRHPLMVSGTWDFVGILFAASGFLAFGGPFVISSLNESWRVWFLLGPNSAEAGAGDRLWIVWLLISAVYFLIIVIGAGLLLLQQRKHTVIYNIDLVTFEEALAASCTRLGLRPTHSGTSYLFDPAKDYLRTATSERTSDASGSDARVPRQIGVADTRQVALMEVDYFRPMRHITLRWSAANSVLRREVEAELTAQLDELFVPPGELGAWLTVLAFLLLGLSFLAAFAVVLYRFVNRI
jgi:hypothetical protein